MSRLFITVFILLLFTRCSQNNEATQKTASADSSVTGIKRGEVSCLNIRREALKMDSTLMQQTEINQLVADNAMKAFTDLVWYCGNDSLSPVYLIKTAQVARAVNNIPQAKASLEKCISEYPQFTNRPAALFMMGQLYDEASYLNDEHEAKKYYQKIIDEYPSSEWVTSARAAISYLGKTDDEIMKELKKKQKKKS
jgi:TolA-binding protein